MYPLTVTEDIKSVLAEVEAVIRDAGLPLCGTRVERIAHEHPVSEWLESRTGESRVACVQEK